MNVKLLTLLTVSFFASHAVNGEGDPFRSAPLPDGFDPFNPNANKKAPAKEFQVSKANSTPANKALFLKLWEALTNPRFSDGAVRKTFWITQAVGKEGKFHRYLAGDDSVLLLDGNLLEDANVSVWVNRSGVFDFTTVAGSTRRVAEYTEAIAEADSEAPTQEAFVESLKSGETFTVWLLDPKGCLVCNGDGKMSTLQGGGSCETCQGTGESLQTYILKW